MDIEKKSEKIADRYRDSATLILSLLSVLFIFAGILIFAILLNKNGPITDVNEQGEEIEYFYLGNKKLHGFHAVKGYLCYYDPIDGHKVKGKHIINGKEYYFDPQTGNLTMNRTIKFDDGTSVYYNRYGNPKAPYTPGLLTDVDGTTVLYGTDGKLKGWRVVDGKTYYFQNITGRMLKNETAYIDGKIYSFDENGQATEVTEQ